MNQVDMSYFAMSIQGPNPVSPLNKGTLSSENKSNSSENTAVLAAGLMSSGENGEIKQIPLNNPGQTRGAEATGELTEKKLSLLGENSLRKGNLAVKGTENPHSSLEMLKVGERLDSNWLDQNQVLSPNAQRLDQRPVQGSERTMPNPAVNSDFQFSSMNQAMNVSLAQSQQNSLQAQPGAQIISGMGPQQMSGISRGVPGLNESQYSKDIQTSPLGKLSPKASLKSNLSGGEFLNTLGMVRSGMENAQSKSLGGLSSQKDAQEDGLAKPFQMDDLGSIFTKADKEKKLEPEKPFSESLRDSRLAPLHNGSGPIASLKAPVPEITAQVVPGAMAQKRLSTDALVGMSSGIRNLTHQGGGEMRIRLKPETLGELNVRVVTDGARVGLQIQASDEKARKVIEDSMNVLKESLSAQNLSLSQVDVTVADLKNMNGQTGSDANQNSNPQSHQFANFQDQSGRSNQQSRQEWQSQESRWLGGSTPMRAPSTPVGIPSSPGQISERGRLDVTA